MIVVFEDSADTEAKADIMNLIRKKSVDLIPAMSKKYILEIKDQKYFISMRDTGKLVATVEMEPEKEKKKAQKSPYTTFTFDEVLAELKSRDMLIDSIANRLKRIETDKVNALTAMQKDYYFALCASMTTILNEHQKEVDMSLYLIRLLTTFRSEKE